MQFMYYGTLLGALDKKKKKSTYISISFIVGASNKLRCQTQKKLCYPFVMNDIRLAFLRINAIVVRSTFLRSMIG